MEERIIKFSAKFFIVLTVMVCVCLYFFPSLHVKAVEWADERQALAELVTVGQPEMKELTLGQAEGDSVGEAADTKQLQFQLPEGVSGQSISIEDKYITQTVVVGIPAVTGTYFDQDPVTGSSNHIDNLSYAMEDGQGVIEIALDNVYEIETSYDDNYFYIDFLEPHEVYDKIVVIDAGHGGRAPGATIQGSNEKDIDLAIVLQLKAIFDESDQKIGVYYTRVDDSNPTFDQRVQLANKLNADLFISIHNNSTRSGRMSTINGTQVMYSESDTSGSSKNLAQICLEEVTAVIGSTDKGLVEGDDEVYIIRTSEVPVALIEVGFMTNQRELDLLNSEEYQKQTALGIYQAISRALEEGY